METQAPDRMDPEHFARGVAEWAYPAQLAPLYAHGLSAQVVERLAGSPRLSARHRAFVAATLGEVDFAGLTAAEAALVSGSIADLDRAAVLAGAAWHARSIRGLVLAADLGAFLAACGPVARKVALGFAGVETAVLTSPLALVDAVRHDGLRCRAAWIAPMSSSIRTRLDLRLGPLPKPDPVHCERGPEIVRSIAQEAMEA